ncbi:MAG: hypothetical protein GY845_25920 [Planctomycetes bacterium]|nr:hypothetical protein [Planctomycetota bacterium]
MAVTSKIRNRARLRTKKNDVEDPPVGSSKRGSVVPVVIGQQRVQPVSAWVGNRRTVTTHSGGGKGGGAASGSSYTKYFFESTWHLLCVGPAYSLSKIYENGELIFEPEEPLTPINAPSGSLVTVEDTRYTVLEQVGPDEVAEVVRLNQYKAKKGSFTIYWGDSFIPNYETDVLLGSSDGLNIDSGWPGVCYIVWQSRLLGSHPNWPSHEYEISTELPTSAYSGSLTYAQGECVTYLGNIYWYISETPASGNLPTDTDYWHLMETNAGLTTSDWRIGDNSITLPAYSPSTTYSKWDKVDATTDTAAYSASTLYSIGDNVSYLSNVYTYIYKNSARNKVPTNTTFWEQVDAYNAGTTYSEGDIVSYSSVIYEYINSTPASGKQPDTETDYWKPFNRFYIYINDTPASGNDPPNDTYWDEYVNVNGINPASMIKQILTATYPWGVGMDSSYLNNTAIEALGVICESEFLAFNATLGDGDDLSEIMETILIDTGVYLSQYQFDLVAVPLRDGQALTTFSTDVIAKPNPSRVTVNATANPSRIIYLYPDRYNEYEDAQASTTDVDSRTVFNNRVTPATEEIKYATDNGVATTIAQRRYIEQINNAPEYSVTGARDLRFIRPGQLIGIPVRDEALRVVSIELDTTSGACNVLAIDDIYDTPVEHYESPDTPVTPRLFASQEDALVAVYELPYSLNKTGQLRVTVLRQRTNEQTDGAIIWATPDDSTIAYAPIYQYTQNKVFAGTLATEIKATDVAILDFNPEVTLVGPSDDKDIIPDLSGDDESWLTGRTLVFINDEIFYLKNYNDVSSTTIELEGLIRAQMDTIEETHAVDSSVFIVQRLDVDPIESAILKKGIDLSVKTQPYNSQFILDITDAEAESRVIEDRAALPLPCDNFRGNDINTYVPGGYIEFTWSYRVKEGHGITPGEILAGVAVDLTEYTRDGDFELKIYDGAVDPGNLKRTETITSDTGYYLYTNADLVADFGGESDNFNATVVNKQGNLISTARVVNITRDESAATVDTTPPTPDPLTWATEPYPTVGSESTSITMIADTATDADYSVEYIFECVEGPGNDSSWQPGETYIDSPVRSNTTYVYRTRARDTSPLNNLGEWSTEESTLTSIGVEGMSPTFIYQLNASGSVPTAPNTSISPWSETMPTVGEGDTMYALEGRKDSSGTWMEWSGLANEYWSTAAGVAMSYGGTDGDTGPTGPTGPIGLRGWSHTSLFTLDGAAPSTTVDWSSGTLYFPDNTSVSLNAGTTGVMSALNYIYYDGTSTLKTSTSAQTAMGTGNTNILIGVAKNGTPNCQFQVFGGDSDNVLMTVDNLAADSVTANEINVNTLSAISADIGTVTAGTITGVSGTFDDLTANQSVQIGPDEDDNKFWIEVDASDVAVLKTKKIDTGPAPDAYYINTISTEGIQCYYNSGSYPTIVGDSDRTCLIGGLGVNSWFSGLAAARLYVSDTTKTNYRFYASVDSSNPGWFGAYGGDETITMDSAGDMTVPMQCVINAGYDSGWTQMTSGDYDSFAHGIGAVPSMVLGLVRLNGTTTAFQIMGMPSNAVAANNTTYVDYVDSTNIKVICGQNTYTMHFRSSGTPSGSQTGDVDVRLFAWK